MQQCAGAGTGWQAEPEVISDAGSPGGWRPIPPNGGETPSMPSGELANFTLTNCHLLFYNR